MRWLVNGRKKRASSTDTLKKLNLIARRKCAQTRNRDLVHPGIYPELNGDYIAMRNFDSVILKYNFCNKIDPYPWQRTETLLKMDDVELFA